MNATIRNIAAGFAVIAMAAGCSSKGQSEDNASGMSIARGALGQVLASRKADKAAPAAPANPQQMAAEAMAVNKGPLILVGLLLGLGLRLVYSAWPTRRPVTFSERIAPQLRSAQLRSSLLEEAREESGLLNTLQRVLAPWARNLAPARVTAELFESHALRQRLIRDGNRLDIEQFRLEQLLCSAAGAAIMTLMVILGWVGDVLAALPGVLTGVLACGVVAWVLERSGTHLTPVAPVLVVPVVALALVLALVVARRVRAAD